MFFKKRVSISSNNFTGMTDEELVQYERMYPDRVQHVDVDKLFYDLDHPMESNLRKANDLSVLFGISVSDALKLIELYEVQEIKRKTDLISQRSYFRW